LGLAGAGLGLFGGRGGHESDPFWVSDGGEFQGRGDDRNAREGRRQRFHPQGTEEPEGELGEVPGHRCRAATLTPSLSPLGRGRPVLAVAPLFLLAGGIRRPVPAVAPLVLLGGGVRRPVPAVAPLVLLGGGVQRPLLSFRGEGARGRGASRPLLSF